MNNPERNRRVRCGAWLGIVLFVSNDDIHSLVCLDWRPFNVEVVTTEWNASRSERALNDVALLRSAGWIKENGDTRKRVCGQLCVPYLPTRPLNCFKNLATISQTLSIHHSRRYNNRNGGFPILDCGLQLLEDGLGLLARKQAWLLFCDSLIGQRSRILQLLIPSPFLGCLTATTQGRLTETDYQNHNSKDRATAFQNGAQQGNGLQGTPP